MNRLIAYISFALIFFFAMNSSYAGQRAITIMAPRTCSTWITERKEADSLKMLTSRSETWLLGVMSGLNAGLDSDKNLLSSVNSSLVFDKYCAKNPKADVFDGAVQLILELGKVSLR